MKLHSASSFLFYLFFISFCRCQSIPIFASHYQLLSSSEDIAVFSVSESILGDIFPESLVSEFVPVPSGKEITVKNLLDRVQLRLSILSSDTWEVLLQDRVTTDMEQLLNAAVMKQSSKVYLILVKKDDPLSPLTKIFRTSILVGHTRSGLVFGFTDLKQNITFPSQYKFDDWAIFKLGRLNPSYKQELKIRPNNPPMSFFRTEMKDKIQIYGRIIVSEDPKLLPKDLILKVPEEDEVQALQNQKWRSVPERLEALEELRKKKIISEQDFEKKKQELLKEL